MAFLGIEQSHVELRSYTAQPALQHFYVSLTLCHKYEFKWFYAAKAGYKVSVCGTNATRAPVAADCPLARLFWGLLEGKTKKKLRISQ